MFEHLFHRLLRHIHASRHPSHTLFADAIANAAA